MVGLKVLHESDNVMEGGVVLLTLKDHNILVGDNFNDGMLNLYATS